MLLLYIDQCFLTEEKCGFAWSHEFIKATWKRNEWGATSPVASLVKLRETDILVPCYPKCHLGHRGCGRAWDLTGLCWLPTSLGEKEWKFSGEINLYSSFFPHEFYCLTLFYPQCLSVVTQVDAKALMSICACGRHWSAESKGTRRPLGNWESGWDAENTSACARMQVCTCILYNIVK